MISDFTYLKPGSMKEALQMLKEHEDECKVICGGQSLLVIMRQGLVSPEYVIDIKRLEDANYLTYDAKDGLKIGATCTHRTIEHSAMIKEKYPALEAMEEKLASIQVRNWGTIAGNLAHGDPAGDPAPVLIAMGGSVKLGSTKGERVIPLDEFYPDLFETVMDHDELIVEVQVPPRPAKSATKYQKFNLLESDMGLIGVAVTVTMDGDKCKDARVVLGSAAPTVIRAKEAEQVLIGATLDDTVFEKAGEAAAAECEPVADIHASEEYRRHLIKVLTKRMAKAAWEQAKISG
ncbi:MAG: xanthine dehydrogenase family protein subunit M [Syntrophorhabdales bacterium]|jgi:carbon-monoxide dehydrogenase medium subunit